LSESGLPPAALAAARVLLEASSGDDRTLPQRAAEQAAGPETLHAAALLLIGEGRVESGRALLELALESEGGRAEWHNDLGNTLFAVGDAAAAAAAFSRAAALEGGRALYWNNLGAACLGAGRPADAESAFRRAIELDPTAADPLHNLAALLDGQSRGEEAAEYHCRAFVLGPEEGKSPAMLGLAYYRLGRIAEAAAVYRRWLDAEPGQPVARHLLAACGGAATPERASDGYVATMFDAYAERFDQQLVGALGYRGPAMIEEALRGAVPAQGTLEVLDAGCGTGLVGERLRPWARHLTGIDLSAGMLAAAARRGLYDRLVQAELGAWLGAAGSAFDLIAIGDALIYFGPLAALFDAARAALRPGGCLVFTVETEAPADPGYRLNPSGRYSHAPEYVRLALAGAGFDVCLTRAAAIRREFGSDVAAAVVLARRR